MKLLLFLLLLFLSNAFGIGQNNYSRDTLNHVDKPGRFFGIHFDLHAHENMQNMGRGVNDSLLNYFLTTVKPDFIQVDCKGHSGISSYPTQIGFKAKSYYGDPMQKWRNITTKHGVELYVHFSGIFDKKVVQQYPEYAITAGDGSKSKKICSPYSPYAKTYLIPQLIELAEKYKIDGAWIDGECWAFEPDYGTEAKNEFLENREIGDLPKTPSDSNFYDFMHFQRQLFKNHVKTYLHAVKEKEPDFQITSNWAFSSMMPEPVTIDLDFLSGDLTPGNAVYRAAFESRCMADRGVPWDIMAWSFSWDTDGKLARNTKSSLQINQELAHILAMGGGVQVYFKQQPDLSIIPWNIADMQDISSFVRNYEPYCFKTDPIYDIGLLYSGFSYYHQIDDVYPEWDPSLESLQGTLNLLLDNQYSANIIYDFALEAHINNFNAIVIPNWDTLATETRTQLTNYVHNGGNLIIVGDKAVKNFSGNFNFQTSDFRPSERVYTGTKKHLFEIQGKMVNINSPVDIENNLPVYTHNDYRNIIKNESFVSFTFGKGNVALISFDLGHDYMNYPHFAKRDFFKFAIDAVQPNPKVQVSGSNQVHVMLRQKEENDQIHLINVSGPHANEQNLGYDEISAINDVNVQFITNRNPEKITLQPDGYEIPFSFNKNILTVHIEEIPLYKIIEINYP